MRKVVVTSVITEKKKPHEVVVPDGKLIDIEGGLTYEVGEKFSAKEGVTYRVLDEGEYIEFESHQTEPWGDYSRTREITVRITNRGGKKEREIVATGSWYSTNAYDS
ncbi:MAG: hypothetical protein V1838_03225 [Patescibacteria group bacterium]